MYRTKVCLEDMHFYSYHGFYEQEQKMGNDYLLTVEVQPSQFDDSDDDINDTVNYEDLYRICKQIMETKQQLLETVAAMILDAIKATWPDVSSASVVLKKATPQLGGRVRYSVISMEF